MNIDKAVWKNPIDELWKFRRDLTKTKHELKAKMRFLKMQSNLNPANRRIIDDLIQMVDDIKT